MTQKEIDALGPAAKRQIELMNVKLVDSSNTEVPVSSSCQVNNNQANKELEFLLFEIACLCPKNYAQAQVALNNIIVKQNNKPNIKDKISIVEASLNRLKNRVK